MLAKETMQRQTRTAKIVWGSRRGKTGYSRKGKTEARKGSTQWAGSQVNNLFFAIRILAAGTSSVAICICL